MKRERFREVFSVVCAPGADMNVSMVAEDDFHLTKMVIGGATASFEIWDILIANESQLDLKGLIGAGEEPRIPALLFSPVAVDFDAEFDVCPAGRQISVKLRNKSQAPACVYIRFIERKED